MKKLILIFILVGIIGCGSIFAQDFDTKELKTGLEQIFINQMKATANAISAGTLNSSNHIGNLPHFSVGYSSGLVVSSPFALEVLSGGNGNPFSSGSLANAPFLGFGMIATLRVGGFRIKRINVPFDMGLSFSLLNDSILGFSDTIANLSAGLIKDAGYNIVNFGFDVRAAIFQEQRKVPGVNFGLGYTMSYIGGSAVLGLQTLVGDGIQLDPTTIDVNGVPVRYDLTLDFADPKVTADLWAHQIFTRIQASKLLLFWEPYVGIEPAITITNNKAVIDSANVNIKYTATVNGQSTSGEQSLTDFIDDPTISGLALSDNDKDLLKITNDGFVISSSSVSFGTKLYVGSSFRIWKFYFTGGYFYEPFSAAMGSNMATRFTY